MDFTGKIIAVLPEKTGTSTKGEWKSQQYVAETVEQYPKRLLFDVFGAERIAQFSIQEGETVTVSFDTNAHEHEGKWFASNRAWGIRRE
ncbi:MAG: DUF3127 domain-containing protein [Bacteroidaceae bacterium]|nr:DUF3127 domain-containing protein [Prevotellaceae bacterium]MDY5630904.1 DUF3127 domain-containing protein [Bacteroidaceae bacterium]